MTNDTKMIEEQMKKDELRKEIAERYWDDIDTGYDFIKGLTDFDNKPVIGFKSDYT